MYPTTPYDRRIVLLDKYDKVVLLPYLKQIPIILDTIPIIYSQVEYDGDRVLATYTTILQSFKPLTKFRNPSQSFAALIQAFIRRAVGVVLLACNGVNSAAL